MKYFLVFSVIVIVSTFAEKCTYLEELIEDGEMRYISTLYKEVQTINSGNFLICPLSVQLVFALVNSGAKGNTSQQIATALHLPADEELSKQVFTNLAKSLQVDEPYTLSSANKIYLADSFNVSDKYKKTAVDVFRSDIQNINFDESAKATKEINAWVEQQTHNKIKDLVSEDVIGSSTIAVLINALYFQGMWLSKFEKTFQGLFKVNSNNTVSTEMMYKHDTFYYYYCPELKTKFIELYYLGEEIAMTIVLPDAVEGLSLIEDDIGDLLQIVRHIPYSPAHVNVTLPKFKIESTTDLLPILRKMGIMDAFTGEADFSGIGQNQEKLIISHVLQKAFIEVDEQGTTAAAATVVVSDRISMTYEEVEFVADHPFLFFLEHKLNGIFFIGRYMTS